MRVLSASFATVTEEEEEKEREAREIVSWVDWKVHFPSDNDNVGETLFLFFSYFLPRREMSFFFAFCRDVGGGVAE